MSFVVEPSAIESGVITVPGDKSISHRALMLGAAASGTTSISGFLAGEDCLATAEALRSMGVTIEQPKDTEVLVHGSGLADWIKPDGPIDLGNSGTAIRLFAGLLSGSPFPTELTGDESLMSRPMNRVIRPLTMMGAEIASDGGMPPLQIKGVRDLAGINYRLPVASAQVKSAILLAGLRAEGDITIEEPAVTRDHTERMLRSMGAVVTQGGTRIQMRGGQSLNGVQVEVPADLSSAAFLILAATIGKAVTLEIPGVGINPTRTGMIDILQAMGADISLNNVRLQGEEPVADLIVRSASLTGIDVDPAKVSLAIDEFPVLFIAAACAEGRTRFSGIGELRVKESDRIFAMADGLRALGISVDESEDGAVVQGGRIRGGHVASHGDHRIAMSFAIAGTVADHPVTVSDTRNVDTSFPGFVDCLQSLGVSITRVEEKRE